MNKQNHKLKSIIGLHGVALFFLGMGMGMIRANNAEASNTVGLLYLIPGAIVAIFTTYSIINKLKTIKMKGGKLK